MRKNRSVFKIITLFATIFFVLVGDGTETSMLGYDTFLMKTDGHVTRLLKQPTYSGSGLW